MSLLSLAVNGGIPILPDPRPVPLDATIAAMRPTGRRIGVLEVAADGSKPYTNVRTACTAAGIIQSQRMADEGAAVVTPNYRVDIVIYPGTYANSPKPSAWVAIYGTGSGEVTVIQDLPNAELGTVTPNGSIYIEGITFIKDAEVAGPLPKYPIHNVNAGTSIFADVVFDNRVSSGTSYGSDGADRGYTVLYKCSLVGGVNAHGWATTLAGQQIAFVDCTANGSVGWDALNNTAPDECWVVGGAVGSITVAGAATTLHRDPATVVAGSVAAPIQDANTSWPVPVGGLSAYDRAFYGM